MDASTLFEPVVGRDVALDALDAALASALAGRGRLVLVSGEAGMGKTTVVRAAAEQAAEAGAVVRWGACWEGTVAPPFDVWLAALRRPGGDACAAVAERLEAGDIPGLAEVGSVGGDVGADATAAERVRSRFFAEVVDALSDASSQRPQVVVLEDVHRADRASLLLLAALAGNLPSIPVLVAATYRDDEMPTGSPVAGLGGAAETLALTGLGVEHVGTLLERVLGRPPSAAEAEAVHRQTGGNPLFVNQVGRLLASGGAGRLPDGVRDVLSRRLARLSSACHRVLGAASVLGAELDVAALAAVLGDTSDDRRDDRCDETAGVLASLDEAAAAKLVAPVEDSPERWAFVHDLVRSVRYEELGTAERAELHRRALEVLEARGAAPGVLAHHAARARFDPGDERPAELAVAAAREALARFAWNDAAARCEWALDSLPADSDSDVRAEALLALGGARLRTGDPAAAEAFRAGAELGRRLGRPELVARAALGFAAGLGGFEVRLLDERQLDLLEEAEATLPHGSPLRPLVQARLSVALSFVGSADRRLELAGEAVEASRRLGDDPALAAALAARCDALAGPDHVDERLAAATEIVGLAKRHGERSLELLGRRLRAVALLERRDLRGFEAEHAAFARAAEALGDPLYTWYVPMWAAMRAHADGRLDEAGRLADEAAELGAAGGSANADLLRLVLAHFLAVDRQDPEAVDAARAALVDRHPDLFHQEEAVAALLALVDVRAGRLERARTELRRAGPEVVDRVPRDQEWLAVQAQLLTVGVMAGDDDVVRRAHELLLPHAGLGAFEGAGAVDHGVADRFLALGAAHLGDPDAARRHVDAALLANAGWGRLVVAHTLTDGARALLHGPEPADAERGRELARRAAEAYDDLGLDGLAAEARALAGAGEGRPRAVGPPTSEEPALVREGDTWAVTFGGRTVRIRHAKGLADLAVLLSQPGRDVHVRVLEGVDELALPSSEQAALDSTAVAQYRARLEELEEDLAEAEAHADLARAERVAAERDALVEQLTGALGLGGRPRSAGSDPDDRLRKAVSARVRASISRLERLHPALGRHLGNAVHTGFWCSYRPEEDVTWTVSPDRPS